VRNNFAQLFFRKGFMRLTLILLLLLFSSCGGASGEDLIGLDASEQNCNFHMADFLNGNNAQDASTYWDCRAGNQVGVGGWFRDGTGVSDGVAFTWSQTGCDSIDYVGTVAGEVTNMRGSINSGIFTYTQRSNGYTQNVSCVLRAYGN